MSLGYFRAENWSLSGTEIDAVSVCVNKYRKVTVKKPKVESFVYCCPIYLGENRILDEIGEGHCLNIKVLTGDGQFLSGSLPLDSHHLGNNTIELSARKKLSNYTLTILLSWRSLSNIIDYSRLGHKPKVSTPNQFIQ
jgi:hypothetical protein